MLVVLLGTEICRKTAIFMATRTRKRYKTTSFRELERQSARNNADMQQHDCSYRVETIRADARKRTTRYQKIRECGLTRVTIDGIQESSAESINSLVFSSPIEWHTENVKANR